MSYQFTPLPSGMKVVMGSGNFAVGGCISQDGALDGIIYLPLPAPRPVGTDATDLFPIGSIAMEAAAVIYFENESAIRQSIDVLNEVLEQHIARKSFA